MKNEGRCRGDDRGLGQAKQARRQTQPRPRTTKATSQGKLPQKEQQSLQAIIFPFSVRPPSFLPPPSGRAWSGFCPTGSLDPGDWYLYSVNASTGSVAACNGCNCYFFVSLFGFSNVQRLQTIKIVCVYSDFLQLVQIVFHVLVLRNTCCFATIGCNRCNRCKHSCVYTYRMSMYEIWYFIGRGKILVSEKFDHATPNPATSGKPLKTKPVTGLFSS